MRLCTAAFVLFAFFLCPSVVHAELDHLWSQNHGDADNQFLGACFADPFGNVVVCGSFYGTINITTPFTAIGARDVMVAKFSPTGTPMWSARIGFPYPDTGWSATSDNVGNTIVVGSIAPTPEERSAFIARYSPTGVQQWIKYFVASDSTAYCERVGTDPAKQIYVAGRFQGSINLGGSTLVAQSTEDIFFAKFGPGGDHIWSKRFSAGGTFDEVRLDVDPAGQPVLVTGFVGSVDLGGGVLNSVSQYDVLAAKFTTFGVHMWSKRFGLTTYHIAQDVAVDAKGRLAITGESWGNIDFGGGVLTAPGGPDAFLAMLESDGDHMWSKMFGAGDRETGYDVAFAFNSDVLFTAYANGTDPFTFGGDPLSGQADWEDLFIGRFLAANGNHRWSYRLYGLGGSTYGFIGETKGQVFLGGTMTADSDFGGSPLQNNGGEDIFIARYADQLTGAGPSIARGALFQNSPNPFNPQTRIEYSLASTAHAVIEVFDASGAVVTRLDQGQRPAGTHSTLWNGRDSNGRAVASGVYFYRIAGMPEVAARKMVLLK